MATDSMTHQVMIHPKIWFFDVLADTNNKNRSFCYDYQKPNRKTFPGNLIVILCGRRWGLWVSYCHTGDHISIPCTRSKQQNNVPEPNNRIMSEEWRTTKIMKNSKQNFEKAIGHECGANFNTQGSDIVGIGLSR